MRAYLQGCVVAHPLRRDYMVILVPWGKRAMLEIGANLLRVAPVDPPPLVIHMILGTQ